MPNLHPKKAKNAIKPKQIWGSNLLKGKGYGTNFMF